MVSLPSVSYSLDVGSFHIRNLQPSTAYDVSCIGLSGNGYMKENPHLIKQIVITKDQVFHIQKAVIENEEIKVVVNSNLGIPILCFLFNGKGLKIESRQYDPSSEEYAVFSVPSSQMEYSVQCSAFKDNHKSMRIIENM